MKFSPAQLKGRIKILAQKNHADARILIRIYMMERFLERLSFSRYKDKFIIKGGILVTSLIGVALRSTMDIDASIKNYNLSERDIHKAIKEICMINLQDDVTFQLKQFSRIMDEMEYPGIRITLDAFLGKMLVPMKLDISTGNVITPREVEYQYTLLLEDRSITLWSYNLETLLAEKLQTILTRGLLNTRMRDFYDLYELTTIYSDKIDLPTLKSAFQKTCAKRDTINLLQQGPEIIQMISTNTGLENLWQNYQKKYPYAAGISYVSIVQLLQKLWDAL
jgi:predicted nucleotidyltransferase component of viral defense system